MRKSAFNIMLLRLSLTVGSQFGNVLVLAAVFKSQLCRYLPGNTQLTKENLTLLMNRTCKVLGEIAPNCPILEMDLKILRNVQKQLDLYPRVEIPRAV